MERYKKLFVELDKSEEFYQRAFDFLKDIKDDADLHSEAMVLLRKVEKKVKNFVKKHYKDKHDIKNFSEILTSTATNELTKTPEISHIYYTLLLVTSFKMGVQKDEDNANPEDSETASEA